MITESTHGPIAARLTTASVRCLDQLKLARIGLAALVLLAIALRQSGRTRSFRRPNRRIV